MFSELTTYADFQFRRLNGDSCCLACQLSWRPCSPCPPFQRYRFFVENMSLSNTRFKSLEDTFLWPVLEVSSRGIGTCYNCDVYLHVFWRWWQRCQKRLQVKSPKDSCTLMSLQQWRAFLVFVKSLTGGWFALPNLRNLFRKIGWAICEFSPQDIVFDSSVFG